MCSLYLEPKLEDHLYDMSGNARHLDISDLQNQIDQLPSPFILMDDFNAKHVLWGESTCDRWGNLFEQLLDNNDIVLMNDGSPTRFDVYHNSPSAIDLSICSFALRLEYDWSVTKHLRGSDHWPIMLKYARNLPSPCSPKWKINEADWGSFEKFACSDKDVDDFPTPVHAYDHLSNIILDSEGKSIPKTAGLPRRPVVSWWNKDVQLPGK